jgi:glycine betaine/choline ABC-type transport system substrate-binding protein
VARAPAIAVLIVALAGCGGSHRGIVAGSKNFTEQLILGEIAAQQLERRTGEKVERRLNLGGTLLAHNALVKGEIDLYPEYTGTALTAVLKQPVSSSPGAVLARVREGYRQWKLNWLDPLGFNNTFAMVVRGADARNGHIRTLTEARGRKWTLGAGYEFATRPDGLAGFQNTYHLSLNGAPVTMDLGLLYQALEGRKVDMAAGNSTDGLISARDFTILEDDRHYFPPYQAAFVVREGLEAPARDALAELSGRFSDETMRRLNYEVVGKRRPIPEVAREFLANMLM